MRNKIHKYSLVTSFCALSLASSAFASNSTFFGTNPTGTLMPGNTSNVFYGIDNAIGAGENDYNSGIVYAFNTSTNSYNAIISWLYAVPTGNPVVASDGSIYVVSSGNGITSNNKYGSLWHIVNGVVNEVHVFNNTSGEGANPNFITMVPDGRIFGTTLNGGWGGNGTIFEYNPKDGSFSSPQSFSGANGKNPFGLIYANGYLYGVTANGGATGQGALYKWDYIDDANITVLHSFSSNNDISDPQNQLTLSNDGNTLMGTALYNNEDYGGGTFAYSIPTNTYSVVWSGNYYETTSPVQAKDGTWYQSAVSAGNDRWRILAFTYDATKPAPVNPTVVFDGDNSTNNQGRNFQSTPINGLTYNPADNSLIATQQWGGANGDGYINKFIANGTNAIQGTDVYDFNSSAFINLNIKIQNYTQMQTWCYPSGQSAVDSTPPGKLSYYEHYNIACRPTDIGMIVGDSVFANMPPISGAKYSIDVPANDPTWEVDNVPLELGYVYVNFQDFIQNDTSNQAINYCYYHNDSPEWISEFWLGVCN
jgi:uncharacterized repeat protein (TIGR03803 family)